MPLPEPPTRLVSLDTETTGLDSERHVMFDVALIVVDVINGPPSQPVAGSNSTYEPTRRAYESELARWKIKHDAWDWKKEHRFWLWPGSDMAQADSTALRMNGYYHRAEAPDFTRVYQTSERFNMEDRSKAASKIARLLDGAHILGFNPSFDVRFMEKFLRNHGSAPSWHYHLIDVEPIMLATAGREPPFKSDDLVKAIGVEIPKERHTAMADARLALECYEKCLKINRARINAAHNFELEKSGDSD